MMWSNITGVVGAALQQVQKIQNEIENQMDNAVGLDANLKNNEIEIIPTVDCPSVVEKVDTPETTSEESLQSNSSEVVQKFEQAITSNINVNPIPEENDLPKKERNKKHELVSMKKLPMERKETKSGKRSNPHSSSDTIIPDPISLEKDSYTDVAEPSHKNGSTDVIIDENESQKSIHSVVSEYEIKLKAVSEEIRAETSQKYELMIQRLKQTHEEELKHSIEECRMNSTQHYETLMNQQELSYKQEANALFEKEKLLWKQNVDNVEKTYQQMLAQLEEKYKERIQSILTSTEQQCQVSTDAFSQAKSMQEDLDRTSKNFHALQMEFEKLKVENSSLNESIEKLQYENATLVQSLQASEQNLSVLSMSRFEHHDDKSLELQTLQTHLTTLNNQLRDLNQVNTKLQEEMDSLRKEKQQLLEDVEHQAEVVTQRERALETSTKQFSQLQQEFYEKEQQLKALQTNVSATTSNSKLEEELRKLQDVIKEKQYQLQEFEIEGKNLAKKQSEMEQKVRKSKNELKEKDSEIQKLKDSKESGLKTIESMQEMIRTKENEVTTLQKTIMALQTVNQTSSEKITKVENELNSKNDELLNYKRSIENTWTENNECKKLLMEKNGEIQELKKQLGENTSRVMETESSRRDIEQREAILRATSKQYQENLLQQMQEKAMIEEKLKNEIQEVRIRWQEAIEAREHLATEITQVSQPLIKEIQSLQEQLRNKVHFYQENERQLMEKLCKFETMQEQFEHRKTLYEENYAELKSQYMETKKILHQTEQDLYLLHQEKDKLLAKYEAILGEKRELEMSKAQEYNDQIQRHQQIMQELECRHNSLVQSQMEQYEIMSKEKDAMIIQLQNEIKQLQDLNNNINNNHNNNQVDNQSIFKTPKKKTLEATFATDRDALSHREDTNNSPFHNAPANSFVAQEKLMQRKQFRDEEIYSLQIQISQLEAARNALLEEVSFLSSRNSQLEEAMLEHDVIQTQLSTSRKQVEVLLVLLGEKEEELEALLHDMNDVKLMYKSHIEDLLQQIAPSNQSIDNQALQIEND